MTIIRLDNPVKRYAWGDPFFIPRLLGLETEDGGPVAELWMGAHETDSSRLNGGHGLLRDYISDNPAGTLGQTVCGKFNGKLPFLFKVLAAAEPLSIQAHPDRREAEDGFLREESRGIALDDYRRNFKDKNHKPEILCALTPFTALCGFRRPSEIARKFSFVEISGLRRLFRRHSILPEADFLKRFMDLLLTLPFDRKMELIDSARENIERLSNEEAFWVGKLSVMYPGDIGSLAPLFLNLIMLTPGEAVFMGAGVLHAYLSGAGIELMANSDNVLRGGLTPKHVDREGLMKIVKFESRTVKNIGTREISRGIKMYETSAEEFSLLRISAGGGGKGRLKKYSPMIIFCIDGMILLNGYDGFRLERGQSCFISPDNGILEIGGNGLAYAARVPEDRHDDLG